MAYIASAIPFGYQAGSGFATHAGSRPPKWRRGMVEMALEFRCWQRFATHTFSMSLGDENPVVACEVRPEVPDLGLEEVGVEVGGLGALEPRPGERLSEEACKFQKITGPSPS